MTKTYSAFPGLHVVCMSARYAEEWTRLCYNVPAHVGLGWQPYRILVQSYGGMAHTAFHSFKDFRRWLGNHGVTLHHRGRGLYVGTVTGELS